MTFSILPSVDYENIYDSTLTKEFRLLSSKRRQQVIWYMTYLDHGESVTVRQLAKQIVAQEEGIPVEEVSNDVYRSVYGNLTQHHLQKLAQAHVVAYDADRKEVQPGPNVIALAVLMAMGLPTNQLLLGADLDS